MKHCFLRSHQTPLVLASMRMILLSLIVGMVVAVHGKNSKHRPYHVARFISVSSSSSLSLPTSVLFQVRGGGSKKNAPTMPPKKGKTVVSQSKNTKTTTSTIMTGTGTATMMSEIFNLVKNIVGVAVLSLPASMALISSHPTILYPCLLLIVFMGILSGYGFSIIGKVCSYTSATSYREAWMKSIHPSTSWIPALSSTSKTFLTCIAISMVLTDTFVTLLTIPTTARTYTLLSMTGLILIPLCWMKNLASLSPFSLLGIMGMIYTAIAMTIRYFDGSYSSTNTGLKTLLSDVPLTLRPKFSTTPSTILQPSTLVLLCTLSTAYMAHFNAPKFYNELLNNTMARYNQVVSYSFGISIILMGFITAIGFLTFGAGSSSVILNNYASKDALIRIARIAVALSLIFTYPLAFQGCRDGVLDLMNIPKEKRTNTTLNQATLILLSIITLCAALLNDVGLVLAIGGGTFFVCFFLFFVCECYCGMGSPFFLYLCL
jgi:amino acid permease